MVTPSCAPIVIIKKRRKKRNKDVFSSTHTITLLLLVPSPGPLKSSLVTNLMARRRKKAAADSLRSFLLRVGYTAELCFLIPSSCFYDSILRLLYRNGLYWRLHSATLCLQPVRICSQNSLSLSIQNIFLFNKKFYFIFLYFFRSW